MKNFREYKAYRLSLYLLLLTPLFAGLMFLSEGLRLGIMTAVFVVSVPLLFLASLSLRFLSLNPLKRWMDFIFIFLATVLMYFTSTMSHTCPASQLLNGSVSNPQWTPAAIFDVCSPYDILEEMQTTTFVFFTISLILAIKFLISDIKRKKTVENIM